MLLLLFSLLCSGVRAQFGQVLAAYSSGVGLDTVGAGGINTLAIAFFDPAFMAKGPCDFTDMGTPCLSLSYSYAMSTITSTQAGLSSNTSPTRGGKPIVFFSFGGQTMGGASWDDIFASATKAAMFGQNAGKLVNTVAAKTGNKVYIGIDLDIEGTKTELPHFGEFISNFRQLAAFDQFPLQMCALSGLASSDSNDYYKMNLLQHYGPAQKGLNYLNMMVNNIQASCDDMAVFWRNPALDFLPPTSKLFGFWGINLAVWILQNPGCTDGADPLYPWMKAQGVGMGIWQWWLGDTTPITTIINQVRMAGTAGNETEF